MGRQMKLAVNILVILLVVLTLSWVFGALLTWDAIVSKPERLAQLISDSPFIILAGFAAIFGLRAGKRWAPALFAFSLGAFVYATARTVAYLIWDNYFGIPWAIAFIALLILTAYAVFAMKSVVAEHLV